MARTCTLFTDYCDIHVPLLNTVTLSIPVAFSRVLVEILVVLLFCPIH